MAIASIQPDAGKLDTLLGAMVHELGAAANAALVIIGDKLGLYRVLAEGTWTPMQLAKHTGTNERYVREWLAAQAASGFVTFDVETEEFSLTPEQAAVLADDSSPVCMTGGFYSLAAIFASEPALAKAYRTGSGVAWGDHCNCLFCGTERFFRPGYQAHLTTEWLPALTDMPGKLHSGARVADVGCGHGASTFIMAAAYPRSQFVGIDLHGPSIEHAQQHASEFDNVRFEVAKAQDYLGCFDLVTVFDALHDMGDPVGAAAHIRETLSPGGSLMLVEPRAEDRLADNLHPIGRVFYAFSASLCVPNSLSQEVGAALGAQAGERRLRDVLRQAGFAHVERVAETPFNMVLEARVQ